MHNGLLINTLILCSFILILDPEKQTKKQKLIESQKWMQESC